MSLRKYLDDRETEIARQIEALRAELAEIAVAKTALNEPGAERQLNIRPGSIKEAILDVLGEHPDGLKTDQIIDVLEKAGKKVERSSMTPQLSRLKAVGALKLVDSLWILTAPGLRDGPEFASVRA